MDAEKIRVNQREKREDFTQDGRRENPRKSARKKRRFHADGRRLNLRKSARKEKIVSRRWTQRKSA